MLVEVSIHVLWSTAHLLFYWISPASELIPLQIIFDYLCVFIFQANTVFDSLNITRNYNGPVLFLEEDHFVAPDFYHMLHLLYERKLK